MKGEINLHKKLLFVWDEAQWILPGELQIDFYGILWGIEFIPKETLKSFVYKEEPELTWQIPLNEFHPKETEAVCVNRFHLLLWTSMALCMITYIIT